jgi:1,4-alpha-glucan branching enzyme
MPQGILSFVLHAHLPFVRHPEHEDFLEEDWLFEAITETYLPLLLRLERLADEGIPTRFAVSLSPTLTAMLDDELLRTRYLQHLDNLVTLADKEVLRTRGDAVFQPLARRYRGWYRATRRHYVDRYRADLPGAFRALQDAGAVELMTCAATHGFLPLLKTEPEAVRAQVLIGQESHRRRFGRPAAGIWLPECGYYPGLEDVLLEGGLRYFVVESHGLLHASVRPRYGLRAPIACPNGVAAFARDPESSQQVWSADHGYPGDFDYREFYRDIGFDLDFDYIQPHILDGRTRIFTGIKYYRVTGPTNDKQPYRPAAARRKVRSHARHFLAQRAAEIARCAGSMDRDPHILCPYDAELFGHWWFEGPDWLEAVARTAATAHPGVQLASPSEYLARHPELQVATPSASSWGAEGYSDCWLSGANAWIYPHLHRAARRLSTLAAQHPDEPPGSLTARALNQAVRSLLIAQASDWPFILKTGTSTEYPEKRIRDHLARCRYLCDAVDRNQVDAYRLTALEMMDNLFPWLDYRLFAGGPPALDVP